jgi:hypothetical protein
MLFVSFPNYLKTIQPSIFLCLGVLNGSIRLIPLDDGVRSAGREAEDMPEALALNLVESPLF